MQSSHSLVAALAVLGACAHAPPHRPGEERLAAVDFEGNHQIGDGSLLSGLGLHRVLKRGGSPDPYMVQVDADRIRGEYLRKGYLDVGVTSRVERKGDDTTVIYTVEEGPRALTRVRITGVPDDVPVDEVRKLLPLEDGQPFDYEAYDLARPLLLAPVQNAGYARAKLNASVIADRATRTAVVALAYDAGPRCKFGPVEITGVSGELAEAVRERITFAQGQLYSVQAVLQTQRNLYGFGRFSTVRVTPDQGGGEVVAVQVAVSESARHEVQFGGGFGVDPVSYEVRGRAGYTIAGWPYPLDTVTVDLRPAYALLRDEGTFEPRIRALVRIERKDLFWTYTKASAEVGYNYLTVEAYTSYGPIARLGFETPLGTDRVTLRVGWAIEHTGFRDISMLLEDPLRQRMAIDHIELAAAYQQKLVVDLRDHPIEPKLGAYAELNTSEGTKYAGSDYQYFELVPDLRAYLPLPLGSVLAAHARYGAIYGDVPATERFFGGGSISQRGFAERRLSPYRSGDVNGVDTYVPYGGAGLIDTSVEARIPLTSVKSMPLGAAVFLDGGDVTETPGGLDPWNLHWALGAGLRLQTIVGPVRLDVGYRLNRTGMGEPDPDSHLAYHLSIGEAF
ncbi:MAG TPA: BamA/TamA family outer membrane protein [Kofleriaceae bacterium]|nr:BamA/TamA family outer membrane protein [Kofleriaceae bacterium]